MANYRINRISEEIRKEVSDIIRNDVKDPRIAEFSSVVKTEVTGDLRHAKIYVSVMAGEKERKDTLEGLKKLPALSGVSLESVWISGTYLNSNLSWITLLNTVLKYQKK